MAVMNVMMDANLALQIARAKHEPSVASGALVGDASRAPEGGGAPLAARSLSGELFSLVPEILTISSGGARGMARWCRGSGRYWRPPPLVQCAVVHGR